jgi:SAM-dependent methyltransferase
MKTMSKSFRRIERSWEEFWAEFWRIRLIMDDEAVIWKNQQIVEFCSDVLKLREGMTLLDLGCGAGFQAQLFAERGIIVHGIDISAKLIAHANKTAKRRQLSATFEAADMRTFEVNQPFDCVVVLGMSFGFGTDAENRTTLQNIFRAVKPGGKILLTGQHPYSASTHTGPEWMETPEGMLLHRGDFDPITSRLGGSWELVRPDGTIVTEGENPESDGIRCYSVPEMRDLLTNTGFVNINFYGSWFLPPPELQWFSMEMIMMAEKPNNPNSKKAKLRS